MENKKILYVFEYYDPFIMGGAEISGKIRVEKLSQNNKVIVMTPNYKKFKSSIEKRNNYNIIRFPSFRYFFYKNRKKTTQKLRQKNKSLFSSILIIFNIISAIEMKYWIWKINKKYGAFDILHGNNIESDLGIAFSNIKAKKIAHLRDAILLTQFSKSNIFLKYIRSKLRRKIDKFIAISKFIKTKYHTFLNIPENKFDIIYNDVSKEQICELNKKQAREKLNLDLNKKYVVSIGSITKEKGIDFVVEKLAPYLPDVIFLIIGGGYLKEELEKKKTNNVKFLGNISNKEVKYYFKAADIFIVPSKWEEPLGRVSLEAQANNTYTITSKKGGLPETIKNNKTGKAIELKSFERAIKDYFKK